MADIDTAIDYLMGTLISTVSGINSAPDHPTENPPEFPAALAIPLNGELTTPNVNRSKNVAVVLLAVHVSRGQGLNAASKQVRPLLDPIADKLLDADNVTWGGNIDTVLASEERPITWEYGPSSLGNIETHAWFLRIPIKYHRSIS